MKGNSFVYEIIQFLYAKLLKDLPQIFKTQALFLLRTLNSLSQLHGILLYFICADGRTYEHTQKLKNVCGENKLLGKLKVFTRGN